MKFWTAETLWADADTINYVRLPADVSTLVDLTLDALDASGLGRDCLLSIGRHEDPARDLDRYRVDVELAPGVVLQTTCGSTEGVDGSEEDEHEDAGRLADALQEALDACLPIVDQLGRTLHELRMRARRIVGEFQRDGGTAQLIDVQLAPYDHWRGSTEPAVRAILEGPGDNLVPALIMVQAERPSDLEHELAEVLPGLMDRSWTQAELAAKGASGYIDQLALNALPASADAGDVLRRFAGETVVCLPDLTALLMRDGHVIASSGDDAVDFTSDEMVVEGLYLPRPHLDAAVGRPASELRQHPHLSDDITVLKAVQSFEDGAPRVTATIQIPRLLFCSVSGRVWPDEPAESGEDRVVQLRGR